MACIELVETTCIILCTILDACIHICIYFGYTTYVWNTQGKPGEAGVNGRPGLNGRRVRTYCCAYRMSNTLHSPCREYPEKLEIQELLELPEIMYVTECYFMLNHVLYAVIYLYNGSNIMLFITALGWWWWAWTFWSPWCTSELLTILTMPVLTCIQ